MHSDVISGFSYTFCRSLYDYLTEKSGEWESPSWWFKTIEDWERCRDGTSDGWGTLKQEVVTALTYLVDQMQVKGGTEFSNGLDTKSFNLGCLTWARAFLDSVGNFLAIFERGQITNALEATG
jgi:hypothetical protein